MITQLSKTAAKHNAACSFKYWQSCLSTSMALLTRQSNVDSKHVVLSTPSAVAILTMAHIGSTKEHQLSLHDDFPPNFEDTHAQSLHV